MSTLPMRTSASAVMPSPLATSKRQRIPEPEPPAPIRKRPRLKLRLLPTPIAPSSNYNPAFNQYQPASIASIYSPAYVNRNQPAPPTRTHNPVYVNRNQPAPPTRIYKPIPRRRIQSQLRPAGTAYLTPIPPEVVEISSDEDEPQLKPAVWYPQVPCGGIFPTDEHQDDVVVRSVEDQRFEGLTVGCKYWLEETGKCRRYERIGYDFTKQYVMGRV